MSDNSFSVQSNVETFFEHRVCTFGVLGRSLLQQVTAIRGSRTPRKSVTIVNHPVYHETS